MAKILVIDDSPEALEVMVENLQEEGYETLQATNGSDGIKLAKEHTPDLIVCDLRMPMDNDGFLVLEELRREIDPSQIPFIFLTVSSKSGDVVKGFELGAQDYVFKNAQPAEIVARIRSHLSSKKEIEKEKKRHRVEKSKNKVIKDARELACEDINDQLSVMIGRLDLLTAQYRDDTDIIKNLEPIGRSCREIQKLVKELL